jgi:hypothetical protein
MQHGHGHSACTGHTVHPCPCCSDLIGSIDMYLNKQHLLGHAAWTWACRIDMCILHVQVPVHAACPRPCCMAISMLHFHVHAACSCPCCMSQYMLCVHLHATSPCHIYICCMSMSILHICVHPAYPCPCYMFTSMLYAQYMLRVHYHAPCP